MATYTTSEYGRSPIAGINGALVVRRVAHTLSAALAQSTTDVLKVVQVPQGAVVIPPLCSVWSSNDPDSGNNATARLVLTDGTTTKIIIASANLQAADTPISGTFTDWAAIDFFQVPASGTWYISLEPTANDIDISSQLKFVVTYTTNGEQADTTS